MDWMYLFYFLLAALLFWGAEYMGRGKWNEEYTSLGQTRMLRGFTALGIALHHMAQKTCAPWHPRVYTVHGLDVFIPVGYMLVGVFLFCSGLGLYKSYKSKPGYLKGFVRKRILPIVIAFYLSELIYTLVRLAMGEKMDAITVVWYLSGLHMANFNAWYVIVIPFFYLSFWAAFRFCKREGWAIFWVFLFTLAYTVLGAFIDHQNDWWMRGEWWYNSIVLFPLGLLFAKFEKRVTAFVKKGYLFWLLLSAAAFFLLFFQSEWMNDHAWGYYGEWGDPLKIQHRLLSAGLQWLVTAAFVAFWFLALMKVKIGNQALKWLGGVTLEFYLMHGIFVELFGYNFLDLTKSIVYIKNVPLYIAVVLACSVAATLLFSLVWKGIVRLTGKKEKPKGESPAQKRESAVREKKRNLPGTMEKTNKYKKLFVPGAAALVLSCFLFSSVFGGDPNVRVMNGMEFKIPEGYTRGFSDSRYAVWEYTGADRKPGKLILDGEIRDGKARSFSTVEEVMAECDWLSEAEIYLNPQGVRMVRGYADYTGVPERRYYIESASAMLLMCMNEDERYYNREDCEEMMLRAADSARSIK